MKPTPLATVTLLALLGLTGVAVGVTSPLADAGLDQTVPVDTTVHLDGTGSVHPDGTIESHSWEITTPSGRTVTPECPDCNRTQFTPLVTGTYEATLTVTGTDGATANDTLFVHVNDAGPAVDLTGDRTPAPDEPSTYTATAESPDAELEEIAWAVEDQIIAVRTLDGTNDGSELSLAFTDTETHRVQVVVKDTNGRTAYDQLNVKPQDGSGSPPLSWDDVDIETPETGCASNPEGCGPRETPTEEPEREIAPGPKEEDIMFETDGFAASFGPRSRIKDSSLIGTKIEEVGIDRGDNAPWRNRNLDFMIDKPVQQISTVLFGQERETINCDVTSGTVKICNQVAYELERDGGTTNVRSPTNGGAYSVYGLQNSDRVEGDDPRSLEKGQAAEVTIVIQQEKEGIVDKVLGATTDSQAKPRLEARNHIRQSSSNGGSHGSSQSTNGRYEGSDSNVKTEKADSGITAGSGASPEQPVSDTSSSGGASSTGTPSSIAHIPGETRKLL